MAVPVYESSFPNGAAVDAALGLAETSLQPGADLANLASGAATVAWIGRTYLTAHHLTSTSIVLLPSEASNARQYRPHFSHDP